MAVDLFRGNLLKATIIYTSRRLHADGKKTPSHCSSPFADLPASYSPKAANASMISFFDSPSVSHLAVRERTKNKGEKTTHKHPKSSIAQNNYLQSVRHLCFRN
jgi:hypothetical protein